MLDAPAREALPHTTRWFTTLAGHPRAAPVLGAVRLAEQGAKPQQGSGRASAAAAGGGGGGGEKPRKERSEKEKKPKDKAEKKAKPALANGAPGGADAGAACSPVLPCMLLCMGDKGLGIRDYKLERRGRGCRAPPCDAPAHAALHTATMWCLARTPLHSTHTVHTNPS